MKEFLKYSDRKVDKLTLFGILGLIAVFTGVFGFAYEFIFYYFNSGCTQFYWRGGNFLPWINIYATGALLIWLLAGKAKRRPLAVFLISALACGILEYFSGYFMLKLEGIRCWDYNIEIWNFGNIDGFVCLRSVGFFGLSSLFLMYFIIPGAYWLAFHMSKRAFLILSLSLFTVFMADELYNLIVARLFALPSAPDIYKSWGMPYMNYYY